ncbi:MAG TPA: UDP-3-O-(3-hydroxymyristoyl)glucosamine N-acyltransferase [Oceanospirillaceae bacterium]|nr:UDP-3-O-(3-hydroxymyristoyl)glucosamine N-acyltransferase [Oceanospirillaceae bacterium]
MQHLTLGDIAQLLGAELKGEADYPVTGLATVVKAQAHQVSFLANMKYASQLQQCAAGAVILHPDQAHLFNGNCLLLVNPYLGYARLSQAFAPADPFSGIHGSAEVAASARLGEQVNLAPGVVIGANAIIGDRVTIGANTVVGAGSSIGDHSRLGANVTLYHGVELGCSCTVHSGAVIGADGFGFAKDGDEWVKIEQLGGVIVGDFVEIGAGTSIDRGALDNTVIGHGVKLDNQVQIAHNVELGDYTAIAGCTAIAGSTKLGKHCTVAGACGITGHLTLVDGVHVTAMSLVTHSINEPGAYSSGTGLDKNQKWRRNAARFKQLDQMAKRLKQLEADLQQLKG